MIRALRRRARPDNLVNQVRAGGKDLGRRIYLWTVVALCGFLALQVIGPWVFLDAEGLVNRDRNVIAAEFTARVAQLNVQPGDRVSKGMELAVLHSRELIDALAENQRRRSTLMSRDSQVTGRITTIDQTLPNATERRKRAASFEAKIASLAARNLTTLPRQSEAQKELYEAQKEETTLKTERVALENERENIRKARFETDREFESLDRSYNNGRVIAPLAGIVGPKVPSPGTVIRTGDPFLDVYNGDLHALAYLPTGRLYSIQNGDLVFVTDGQTRSVGRVQRIEEVTDSLPGEFQTNFQVKDRKQVIRIAFDVEPAFPLLAKIKVTGRFSPQGLIALTRSTLMMAGEAVFSLFRFVGTAFAMGN